MMPTRNVAVLFLAFAAVLSSMGLTLLDFRKVCLSSVDTVRDAVGLLAKKKSANAHIGIRESEGRWRRAGADSPPH